jgi:hypothetical protein
VAGPRRSRSDAEPGRRHDHLTRPGLPRGVAHGEPDGAVLYEEELVATRRVVVRERVVFRKRVTSEETIVRAELRGERISIEADPPGS